MKLNATVNRIRQNPETIELMQEFGLKALGGTPEAAGAFVKREMAMVHRFIPLEKIAQNSVRSIVKNSFKNKVLRNE